MEDVFGIVLLFDRLQARQVSRHPAAMSAVFLGVSMTTAFIFRTSIMMPEHWENPS